MPCCVTGCSNRRGKRSDPKTRFFTFPTLKKDREPQVEELSRRRREAWVSAVKRPNITLDSTSILMYICCRHFHKGQPANETQETDPDWVPSLHLGHSEADHTDAAKGDKQRQQKTNTLQMPTVAQIIKEVQNKEEANKAQALNTVLKSSKVQSVCCVLNCGSTSHDAQGNRLSNGLSFYSFPAWRRSEGVFVSELTKRRREAWVTAVARTDITFDNAPTAARVCSRHFVSAKPAYEMLDTDPDWAPSLHLNDNKTGKQTRSRKKQSESLRRPTEEQTESGGASERPKVLLRNDLKSHLQSLMGDKLSRTQPTEDTETTNDAQLDFKDFFRNTLEASLDACISSRPQLTTETKLTLDLSWFSTDKAFVYKKPSSFSAEPLSQTELDEEQATVDKHSSSSSSHSSSHKKTTFQLSWVKKHWFLRYSPSLDTMWCHVCRRYAGKQHRHIAFVVGSKTFYHSKIIQHSNTEIHKQCVKCFKSNKKYLQK